MKLILKEGDIEASVLVGDEKDPATAEEVVRAFFGAMTSLTYHRETIVTAMYDFLSDNGHFEIEDEGFQEPTMKID